MSIISRITSFLRGDRATPIAPPGAGLGSEALKEAVQQAVLEMQGQIADATGPARHRGNAMVVRDGDVRIYFEPHPTDPRGIQIGFADDLSKSTIAGLSGDTVDELCKFLELGPPVAPSSHDDFYTIDSEQEVITALLNAPGLADNLLSLVMWDDFLVPGHRVLMEEIIGRWSNGQSFRPADLCAAIGDHADLSDVGGAAYIRRLADGVWSTPRATEAALRVAEASHWRKRTSGRA